MPNTIFVFYGFSGSPKKPTPSFPDGTDYDKSFQLTAETLADSLKALYPKDRVVLKQTWTKEKLLAALESAADGSIRQVHLCCHGDSTMLSLAYRFDGGARLAKRAKRFNGKSGAARGRALEAMKDEDAIVAGFFSTSLDTKRRTRIAKKHAKGASWQIWGCYAGYESTRFDGVGDAVLDPYLKRFNLGKSQIDGVAVDIATSLGVSVTAAEGVGGLEFWHGNAKKQVVKNDTRTAAKKPFWQWNVARSTWVTFGPTGKKKSQPELFQKARSPSTLSAGKPPKWLTDLYWGGMSTSAPQPSTQPSPQPSTQPSTPPTPPPTPAPAPGSAPVKPLSLRAARRRYGRQQPVGLVVAAWYDDGAAAPDLYRAADAMAQAMEVEVEDTAYDAPAADTQDFPSFAPDESEDTRPRLRGRAEEDEAPSSQPELEVPMEMAADLFDAPAAESEDDDFRRQLEAAMRGEGEYADRAQAERARGAEDPGSNGQTAQAASRVSDPFAHLHPDLAQAKTFDLGSHALARELESFAEQALGSPGSRKNDRVLDTTGGDVPLEAPELDELDMLAALATSEGEVARAWGDPPKKKPAPAKPALKLGQRVPDRSEVDVVGAATTVIKRGTPEFDALVRNDNPDIVFKDEEKTGADLMMTERLKSRLDELAVLVKNEWPELKLRVTEAWDEDSEHRKNSIHYEARAADLTVSDRDGAKLGRLAQLAVDAGLDWVFYEDASHVHVAVKKDAAKDEGNGEGK